ncbi:MAG: CsgG/HfaB family protein [Pirellulaceae bacterium]|nr:CsgG/HfaB family protein [Pirellulaceae bacterium]MDP6556901.1 CsgG/HfaB family protein [Pirellulaceae bacterium]MDP6720228.1 CsgG/HfaB family protein [Pirellulaceae bacterium]
MSFQMCFRWTILFAVLLCGLPLRADDEGDAKKEAVYPVAILPFQERGDEVKEMGGKVTDLLFASLVANPAMYLVDRADLDRLVEEQELSKSGLVNQSQAVRVGQLTGAKILVTGSVLSVGEKLYIVAKIMGAETSRVVGKSVKGDLDDELGDLVDGLAESVASTIVERAEELVAKSVTHVDRLAMLKKKLGRGGRPTVAIDISERHVGQVTSDPAAETEIVLFCTELGFKVLDSTANKKDADILLVGEGFSQFASRHGNLVSVKARLELKALDRKTGQVLAIDRQTSIAVDLAEQIASKSALQESAARIAERLLPVIASKKKSKRAKGRE